MAGGAGGRVQPGLHVAGNGKPVSRIGLTVQQILGVPVSEWGSRSLLTARPIGELLA